MIQKDKLYSIWVYLQAEPLFWLTLTIGSYLVGDYLYKKSKLFPLVNPVAISIFIISLVLINLTFHMRGILMELNLFTSCWDLQLLHSQFQFINNLK